MCHIRGREEKGKVTKSAKTENFPVASLILAPEVRQKVLDFYRQARQWDDIADSSTISADVKRATLSGGTDCVYLNDLLVAFRQDIDKTRYADWAELMDYCSFSANPVGRFLLEIHGENKGYEASDALCTALQILNHLQDCQKDFRALNRIYLPQSFLTKGQRYEYLLDQPQAKAPLRRVFDQCLERVEGLLTEARPLPDQIKNRRLRYQAKATYLCALALAGRLRRQDPLAKRVELGKLDKFLIAYKGFYPL